MALLIFFPAAAGTRIVAADLLAVALHRLHLVAAPLRLARLLARERRRRLGGVVEAEVARQRTPRPGQGHLRLTRRGPRHRTARCRPLADGGERVLRLRRR